MDRRRAPITLDFHLPNLNFPDTGPEAVFDRLVEIAAAAEASGFSSILLMDHVTLPQSVTSTRGGSVFELESSPQPFNGERRHGCEGEPPHDGQRPSGSEGELSPAGSGST